MKRAKVVAYMTDLRVGATVAPGPPLHLSKPLQCHYPTFTNQSARGVKTSPLHDRLVKAGACFKDVSGWEGPDWFAIGDEEPIARELTWGRAHWFDNWRAEHIACRTAAVLIDMSFMSKFLVQGRDAGTVLNRLSTSNVDGDKEMITYTQVRAGGRGVCGQTCGQMHR